MKITSGTQINNVQRKWYLIDVKDQIIGRAATKIAEKLIGKNKTNYVPYLDMGNYVVVVNAAQSKTTGNKEKLKKYRRHSGYPGGLKELTLEKLRMKNPTTALKNAVKGMLPDNKLKSKIIKRLYIFADDKHPYADQIKKYAN